MPLDLDALLVAGDRHRPDLALHGVVGAGRAWSAPPGPSKARWVRIWWVSDVLPSPGAPVTSATMTLARRLYRLLGSAISRAVSMLVSNAAIFGAASAADCCRVAGVAAAQAAVGTAAPSVLPRSLPCGSSTVNSGTTVAPRCEAVATRRQSVRPGVAGDGGHLLRLQRLGKVGGHGLAAGVGQ